MKGFLDANENAADSVGCLNYLRKLALELLAMNSEECLPCTLQEEMGEHSARGLC